jgi:hypothetical protein
MYHASKREDHLLISKFIKDAQYFYKKKKDEDVDIMQIKKIT